ncbi:MAG: ATP-grasp domain-containing protein [Synergistaceae bacterium]|nr:ATP-grasp domain-containing protein [Synergistaceae bacterium]
MKFVCLSPSFPENYANFWRSLKERGATVLGIDSLPYDRLGDEVKKSLTEYYRVNDMENYDELLRACGYFTHRYGRIDRIESHNEYWLDRDARLRTDFNVEGFKTGDLLNVRYKSRMKEVFRSIGIPVARGKIVRNLEEGRALAAETGWPVCVKPDCGVGASSTYKFHSEKELEVFFRKKPSGDFLMEEFIRGEIQTFDGLVDREGRVVFTSSFVLPDCGIMEMVSYEMDTMHYTLRKLPDDLVDFGLKTVKAFGLRERFFHIEFFRTDKGLVALEINARPPGGWCIDMFNYANDADLYDQYAGMVLEGRVSAALDRPYHVYYIGLKEREHIRRAHGRDEILRSFGSMIVRHGPIIPLFAPAMGDYAYLLRSSELEPLQHAAAYIAERA